MAKRPQPRAKRIQIAVGWIADVNGGWISAEQRKRAAGSTQERERVGSLDRPIRRVTVAGGRLPTLEVSHPAARSGRIDLKLSPPPIVQSH